MTDIEPFVWMEAYRVVICKSCRFACVAGEIQSHLRARNHAKPRDNIKEIAQAVKALPGIFQTQHDLLEFPFPAPDSAEVPYLHPARADGLACMECVFVCHNPRWMRDHCRDEHGWKNPRKRGGIRSKEKVQGPWRGKVYCQRFFQNRQASGWFEVRRQDPTIQATVPGTRETVAQAVCRKGEEQRQRFQQSHNDRIQVPDFKLEPNLWLRRTGWAQHLQGLRRGPLLTSLASVQPIQEEEVALQQMCASFQRVVAVGRACASRDEAGIAVLQEVNRKVGEKKAKPYSSDSGNDTWDKYAGVVQDIICFVQRTQEWKDADRPPYRLTMQQGDLWDAFEEKAQAMGETEEPTAEAQAQLDRVCVDAMVSLFDHVYKNHEYESVVLSAMAVMGLVPGVDPKEDDGWEGAQTYTPKYSAVMKIARVLVIRQSAYEHEEEMATLQGQGFTDEEAFEASVGLIKRTRRKIYRFMVSSSEKTSTTPMGWIYDTKAYGMVVQNTTVGEGKAMWKGAQITYQKTQFTMDELCDMVHGLIAEARENMAQLLMMPDGATHEAFPRIDWGNLQDDHSETQVGYSFVDDPRNVWPVDGPRWLMDCITQEKALQKTWLATRDGGTFHAKAVQQYGQRVEQFREQMAILMHITGGGPARGPELLGMRHRNTGGAGIRNIFVHNGMVSFVAMYHKNMRTSESAKVVHRFLPREVGSLLVWYLWLVLPFWQQVQGIVQQADETSPYIWAHDIVRQVDQDGEMHATRTRNEGADQDIRIEAMEGKDPSGRHETASQVWSTDRIRRQLQQCSQRWLGMPVTIAAWRHIQVAISDQYLGGMFQADDEGSDDDDGYHSDEVVNIRAAQTGHTGHTRGMIYGLDVQRGHFGTATMREQFRQNSVRWHRFLALYDREGGKQTAKRKREAWEDNAEEARQRRFQRLRQVNIQGQLEQMVGEGATFRGCQKQVIQAVFRGCTPIIQITGTGGGKSLSFMLPAYCTGNDGVTIVVVPLVALRDDMTYRCQQSHIDTHVWSSRGSNRAASIVFVTPESASTKGFRDFVHRLQARQQLDRVVVDECHMVLDCDDTFRPPFRHLGETIADWGVPMVFLTATLPPQDEALFCQEMRLIASHVPIFRVPTTRPNIAYRVRYVAGGREESIEDGVCAEVKALQRTAGETVRIIVYGGTIERTESIQAALQCPAYHASIADGEGKKRILHEWRRDGGVIVATNALGVGLDVPDVRAVIHAGCPRKLRDFAQESGRGGRDGQKSEAVIVCRAPGRQEAAPGRQEDMGKFMEGRACRRVVMDEVMDGRTDRVGCEEGEEVCDVCIAAREVVDRNAFGFEEDAAWGMETYESEGGMEASERNTPEDSGVGMERSTSGGTEVSGSTYDRIESEASEGGAGTDRQPMARKEFTVMQQRTQTTLAQAKSRRRNEVEEVVAFTRQLDDWVDVCVACRLEYEGGFRHETHTCTSPNEAFRREIHGRTMWIQDVFQQGGAVPFPGCTGCGLPKRLCYQWEAAAGDGGTFHARLDGWCQYGMLVYEVLAGFWEFHIGMLQEEMGKMMIADGHSGGVDDGPQTFAWVQTKVRWGGMETNHMCKVFHRVIERWNRDTGDGLGAGTKQTA